MYNLVSSITRKAVRSSDESLNIICAPTHESYETNLAMTGHNFYAWRVLDGSIKDWDSKYRPVPPNYHLLNANLGDNQIPDWLDVDLVLSQNKFGQFRVLKQIANFYRTPLISLEHTLNLPNWGPDQLNLLKSMRGDQNIFISDFSRKAWGWNENEAKVIPHGINSDIFKPLEGIAKKRQVLSVVNDHINRDVFCGFNLWNNVTQGLPRFPVGNTPGLSSPAKDLNELVHFYNESQIFINTSLISPIPMSLLEAMSVGCAVVSTATAAIPEILVNGENGYLTNDPKEMRQTLERLLDDPAECQRIGNNARKTIIERFSLEKFVSNWNKVFYETIERA